MPGAGSVWLQLSEYFGPSELSSDEGPEPLSWGLTPMFKRHSSLAWLLRLLQKARQSSLDALELIVIAHLLLIRYELKKPVC